MKTFGHFDDQNREYVITDPATPFPWINYLGNEDFFGLISNTAGMPSSVVSRATAITVFPWMQVDATSISTMVAPCGVRGGNLVRQRSIRTSAVMA